MPALSVLVQLIEAMSFYQLQQLALRYLDLRGFRNPTLTDGWNDGGTDLRVMRADGVASRLVVQVSVEKRWKAKLKADIAKAYENYGCQSFIYVSSRRIAELEFQRIADEALQRHGMAVTKADSQALASIFYNAGKSLEILEISGVQEPSRPSSAPRPSFKEDAAFGYLFFSEEARAFRARAIEQAIVSYLLLQPPEALSSLTREQIIKDLSAQLGLTENQTAQVRSAIDRLMQSRSIQKSDGIIQLAPKTADRAQAVRKLNDENWAKLKDKFDRLLASELGRGSLPPDSSPVLVLVGAALCDASSPSSDALSPASDQMDVIHHFRRRMDELDAALQEMGFAQRAQRIAVIQKLVEVASESTVGKALVAAEMFNFVSGLDESKLGIALGSEGSLPGIVLDASVAIPVLLSLLYEPGRNRFFRASMHVYRQARAHRARLSLPRDYLEEAATHLIAAAKDYASVVDLDDDLRGSTNAYVAHYVDLRKRGVVSNFRIYLSGLGARPGLLQADFAVARRALMNQLGSACRRYGIESIFESRPNEKLKETAERELAYLAQEMQRERPRITALHDARVVAHLQGGARDPLRTGFLCTWDRLLISIQRRLQAPWDALDPSVLGDLLSLASADSRGMQILSPVTLAMALQEAEADRGAAIWDWLVNHEKNKLHDAKYREIAREFKEEYMGTAGMVRPNALSRAWEEWKSKYAHD